VVREVASCQSEKALSSPPEALLPRNIDHVPYQTIQKVDLCWEQVVHLSSVDILNFDEVSKHSASLDKEFYTIAELGEELNRPPIP
jgi:hypothetical protein